MPQTVRAINTEYRYRFLGLIVALLVRHDFQRAIGSVSKTCPQARPGVNQDGIQTGRRLDDCYQLIPKPGEGDPDIPTSP
jgi:hypothetical protein